MTKPRYFTVPNILTLLNLLCGCLAVITALTMGFMTIAFIFVVIGAVFDFTDGLAARLLGRYSPMGIQLDSLADMVTFGLAPGAVLFMVILNRVSDMNFVANLALACLALLVPLFSALRLARFNIDDEQRDNFIGLPTPANALLLTSLGSLMWDHVGIVPLWIPVALAVVCSYLLISPIGMFSLKFHNFSWRDNRLRYIFAAVAVVGLAIFFAIRHDLPGPVPALAAVPAVIGLYIVVSTIAWVAGKKAARA